MSMMRAKLFTCLGLSLVLLVATEPAAAQGFKWWQNDRFKQELVLTQEQIGRLEEIFQSMQPTLKSQKETLDKQESRLSKVINDPRADEAKVLEVLERVESARSELSKSRTLLAFRMRRILTADQNVKFKALHEEWVRERRNKSNPSPEPNRGR
jgi:Spy/CpxP family protein refolding chaperone